MKRFFLLLIIMLVSGCATLSPRVGEERIVESRTFTLHRQFNPVTKEPSVYLVVFKTFTRTGQVRSVEVSCSWGNDAGQLIPGPCLDEKESK